jgi:hypothetical protein
MKFKLKVKVTGCVGALVASMLSAALTDFASYSPTTGDNAPRKRRYLLSRPCQEILIAKALREKELVRQAF